MNNPLVLKSKSPSRKILIIVLSAFALQTGYFTYHYFHNFITESQTAALERLKGIANSTALQLDGDMHQHLMEQYAQKDAITNSFQDAFYGQIHTTLRRNYTVNNLKSPIYTLVLNPTNKQFEFGVTSSDKPYFRHSYSHYPQVLLEKGTRSGTIPLYKDEFGSWLTAFAPVKNNKGEVVAILMVDENFSNIMEYVKDISMNYIVLSIILLILMICAVVYLLQGIMHKQETINKDLENAYLEKLDLAEKLQESEEKLKEYAQKLEHSNKDLMDFAHIASHDLKAPIRGISSFIQLLEKRNKDKFDDRDREYFNFIKKNARQSMTLIEDLLNYSKIDKNIGAPSPVKLNDAVERACNNLSTIIEEKNVLLKVDKLPTLNAHIGLLTPLFQNLINNGIKYNEKPQPIIEIGTEPLKSGECIFYVKDNGIGIDEEFKTSIFDMFRRLQSTDHYEGSGIGLAFCKRIINTYHGEIWVESQIGKGSTFFFTLPDAPLLNDVKKEQLVPAFA